jgi:hypothetical protein
MSATQAPELPYVMTTPGARWCGAGRSLDFLAGYRMWPGEVNRKVAGDPAATPRLMSQTAGAAV